MKVERMFHIKFSEMEMNKLVRDHLEKTLPEPELSHFKTNTFLIDFVDGEYVVMIDGALPEEEIGNESSDSNT
jgi:hypothetical protein